MPIKKLTRKKREPLESEIQNMLCEYLALKRRFFWRNNNVPIFDHITKSYRAMPKYAMKGVADIIVINDGGFVTFLEVKRPKGKQSEDQIAFENLCKKWGAEYHIVWSIEHLKELGL